MEQGERGDACQQWLTTREFITSLDEAERQLPAVYSIESTLQDLKTELATAAESDPTLHEQRIEFCRELCNRFPDSDRELRLDLRHAIADSLAELDRETDSCTEFEAIIEEYPDDRWAYLKLGNSYWRNAPDTATIDDFKRAAEIYQLALEHDIEQPSRVTERLDEVQQQLADTSELNKE